MPERAPAMDHIVFYMGRLNSSARQGNQLSIKVYGADRQVGNISPLRQPLKRFSALTYAPRLFMRIFEECKVRCDD